MQDHLSAMVKCRAFDSLNFRFDIDINSFRFTINLSVGSEPAFHFDVRFKAGSDTNSLVRNTLQNGSWGPEERHVPYFPFFYNQFFEMIILCDSECYKVCLL